MSQQSSIAGSAPPTTFSKNERLCSRKEIERLFANGTAITASPLKLIYILRSELPAESCKTMFVVPKRSFRKAHDRNKLRRRIREAFRISKHDLYNNLKEKRIALSMAILYTGKKATDFAVIDKVLKELLQKLMAKGPVSGGSPP